MWSLFADDPAGFAEHHLSYTDVALKTTLRRAREPRLGLGPPLHMENIRRVEVAVALWKLLTRPSDDVIVAIGLEPLWNGWLKDVESLIQLGGSHALKQVVHVVNRKVIHRLIGFGCVKHFLTTAAGAEIIKPCRGEAPTVILSGIDRAPTAVVQAVAEVFKPPCFFVGSIYPRLENGFAG
jgi:hypothetical protein